MLRKLLTTTVLAGFVASGAYAQTATPGTTPDPAKPLVSEPAQVEMVKRAEGHLASNIIGQSVYNGMGDGAENIGDVNDLILNPEGQVDALVIGVGGFLGIGEKDVAIEYDLVKIEEMDGAEVLVVDTTAEALKALQAFNRAAYEPVPADAEVTETKPATAEDLATASIKKEPAEGEATTEENPTEQMAPTDGDKPSSDLGGDVSNTVKPTE